MTIDMAFQLALGLLSGVLGLLLKRAQYEIDTVSKSLKELQTRVNQDDITIRDKIEAIRVTYMTRADSDRNQSLIMDGIKDIKLKINRLDDKLDRKVDK